jgi:signal transduction histidine kinase
MFIPDRGSRRYCPPPRRARPARRRPTTASRCRPSTADGPNSARAPGTPYSTELAAALDELLELTRGIYPAVLTDGGLTPALRSLSDRAPTPVVITATPPERLPAAVEQTCYFLVSEALTNAAKYAAADKVMVAVTAAAGTSTKESLTHGRRSVFSRERPRAAIACDKWDSIRDNLHAIAKTIEAL